MTDEAREPYMDGAARSGSVPAAADPQGDCLPPCRIEQDGVGSPLVAAAIHCAHAVRPALAPLYALDSAARRYEEDPFTDVWTRVAPTRIIATASRFEVDLNRPPEQAIYDRPEDAWGLRVWRTPPSAAERRESLCRYHAFYREVHALLARVTADGGRLLLLDLHSYNHRRAGADAAPAPAAENPEINIGTAELPTRWRAVADAFVAGLRSSVRAPTAGLRAPAGGFDVRENVKFQGGHFPRWVNRNFGHAGCALAVEFRKSYMDEHTGEPYTAAVDAIGAALRGAARPALTALAAS